MTISTNKNKLAIIQVPEHSRGTRRRRRKVMAGRRRSRTRQEGLETPEKIIRRGLRCIQELARQAQLCTIHSTSSGGIAVLPGRGTKAQEDPRKMRVPGCRGQARTEGILETSVKSLHETVRLRVISSGRGETEVQEVGEGSPYLRRKLRTAVRCDDRRHTKTGDPTMKESQGTISSRGRGQGNSLRPSGGPVNNSK